MAYEMETARIELGRGWAVIYTELRHGTQRAVNQLTRPFLDYGGEKPKMTSADGDGDPRVEGIATVELDLTKVDWEAVNDIIIVGQVKEWSFGEVNMETLDDIPESARTRLVMEFNGRYGRPLPDGGGENLAKGCSGP